MNTLTYTSDSGARRTLTVFAGDTLPKAVREAQEVAVEAISAIRPLRRQMEHDREAPQRLRNADEQAARLGEDFDPKKAAKKQAAAEETAEISRLGVIAATARADRAYVALLEAAARHTPAWRSAAVDAIDSAMLRITTAREQARTAGAALAEAMGVVQMLGELPSTGQLQTKGVKTAAGSPEIENSIAIDHLANVIGGAMSFLDDVREAEKAAKRMPVASGKDADDHDHDSDEEG